MLQVGPSLPLPGADSLLSLQERLRGHLDQFTDAPFTLQRLCELLLEPHKQYARLHKLVSHCCADAGFSAAVHRERAPGRGGIMLFQLAEAALSPTLVVYSYGHTWRTRGPWRSRSRQRGGL